MAKMKIISVQLPQNLIHGLDSLVKRGIYPNRSEAIRVAIRELLKKNSTRRRYKKNFLNTLLDNSRGGGEYGI